MTPSLSLSCLFYCVSTSYLFHILIQKEITLLEEGYDATKDFVRRNCVDEETHRRIFCLRPVMKFTLWHITNNVPLIIFCLPVIDAKHSAVHNARHNLRRVYDSTNLNTLFFRQSCRS